MQIKQILTVVTLAIITSSVIFAEETGVTNSITKDVIGKKARGYSDENRKKLKEAKMAVVANPAVDEFVITDTVKLKNPQRIGMCMKGTISGFTAWKGSGMQNVWNNGCAFEPFVFTHNWTVKGAKGSTQEYLEMKGKPGLSWFAVYPDNFWNAGDMYLYRKEGNKMREIHHTTVKRFEILKGNKGVQFGFGDLDGRLHYTEKGPIAKDGDILLIKMTKNEFPIMPKKDVKGKPVTNRSKIGQMKIDKGVQWGLDVNTFAKENGSTASLKLSLPGGAVLGISEYFFAKQDKWIGKLTPGKSYKLEVWLKQEGLKAPVTIRVGHYASQEVSVSDQWQKFSLDIPQIKKMGSLKNCELRVGSSSAGTLWVDNLIVFQTDTQPFDILPKYKDELRSFNPQIIRWQDGGMKSAPSIDAWLNGGFTENLIVAKGKIKGANGVGLPRFLQLCKEVKANAWLNTPLYSKEESLKLMEYLCGPESSPYGKKRVLSGQKEPWLNEFDELVIEVANEPWNSIFAPLKWSDKTYAALANMIFSDMKSSPYYEANKDKIIFCAGGWSSSPGDMNKKGKVSGWTGIQMRDCTEADMTCYADYIGGWDGVTIIADTPEKLYQSQLLYPSQVINGRLLRGMACRKALKRVPHESDNPITLGIYEFGPGYALPNAGKPFIPVAEKLGKSLALGVATLDTAMKYLKNGFLAPQAFFTFGGGYNFNTHSDINLKHATPAYLALKMRNIYCSGDFMQVENKAVKTVNLPKMMGYKRRRNEKYDEKPIHAVSGIPMSSCYAFKDADTYSFIVLNRNVDESRKTNITLPVHVASSAKLYKLTGKPWDTNLTDINITIQEESLSDFSSNYTFDMPASSVYLFVAKAISENKNGDTK